MVSRFVHVLRWGVFGLALGLRRGLTSSGSEGEEAAAPAADAPPEPDATTELQALTREVADLRELAVGYLAAMDALSDAGVAVYGSRVGDQLKLVERVARLISMWERSKVEVAARVKEVRQLDEALGIRQANEAQLVADLELLRTAVQVSHADNASLRARLGVAEARAQQLATAPPVAGARCACGVVLFDGRTLCGRCDPSQRLGPVLDPTAETVPVPVPLAPGEG